MAIQQSNVKTFAKPKPKKHDDVATADTDGQGIPNQAVAQLERAIDWQDSLPAQVEILPPAPIRAVPAPTPAGAGQPLRTIDDCVSVIEPLWSQAQRNFVEIGRYLLRAKDELPHGQYTKLIECHLPFGRSTCHALREIAIAVDSNRFTLAELPLDYTAAYQVVSLPETAVVQAREQGLLTPTTKRKDIAEFKRKITTEDASNQPTPAGAQDDKSLSKQLIRLTTRQARIAAQIAALHKQEREVQAEMAAVKSKLDAAATAQRAALAAADA